MIAAVILSFVACFVIVLALFLAVTAARQSPAAELKRRLRRMEGSDDRFSETSSGEFLKHVSSADQILVRLPLMGMVKTLVEQSGIKISPSRFVCVAGAASVLGSAAVYALKRNGLMASIAAAAIVLISFAYIRHRKQQRERMFTEQLPDVLIMIARSLRAGHSLTGAVELVGQEMPEPAGGLFRNVYEQQRLGMRVSEALVKLLDRIDSVDLRYFVTIIRINTETGGNLSEILEKLAETIRSRLQVRRQVQVYTAQGRLSGYILAGLPVAIFAILYNMLPGYLDVFFTEPKCQMILAGSGCAEVAGFFMIKKIISIRI